MTTVTTNTLPATQRQVDYIIDLAEKRPGWQDFCALGYPEAGETVFDVLGNVGSDDPKFISRREASHAIDTLLRIKPPAKQPEPTVTDTITVTPSAASLVAQLVAALAALPTSKYALPVGPNDALDFYEVVERKNKVTGAKTRYLNRLLGCPGDWNRQRLSVTRQLEVAAFITSDPVGHAKRYSDEYTQCARCDAPLSDERSRKCGFGWTCAQHFGVEW